MLRLAMTVVALALAGCQTTTSNNPVRYTRMDGRLVANHPELAAQAQQDMAICKGEGAKAGLSAGPVYRGSVAASIVADQVVANQSKNIDMVIEGCMAGRGYRKDPGQD